MRNKNQDLPIGIFDSGIGGLTVVSRIHRLLPHEDLIYLGDTARVPYGTKSPNTVIRFACEDTQFLVQQRVKAVVVACNTVSAWALPTLEKLFSGARVGVIRPGAITALKENPQPAHWNHRHHGHHQQPGLPQSHPGAAETAQVFSQACPLLVPLVEEGWTQHAVTTTVLREYLAPLLAQKIDTLVLGCTHYPLLRETIRAMAGKELPSWTPRKLAPGTSVNTSGSSNCSTPGGGKAGSSRSSRMRRSNSTPWPNDSWPPPPNARGRSSCHRFYLGNPFPGRRAGPTRA